MNYEVIKTKHVCHTGISQHGRWLDYFSSKNEILALIR